MFQAFVITLREGIEAALIVGIVLGQLRKMGQDSWNRIVYWSLAAAVSASIVGAYALNRIQINEDALEGWLMLVGAVFVATMVVWMWRIGRRLKQEIETKLTHLATKPSRGAALGLFAFVFLMVFREGVETVLFLAAVSLRTSELVNFIGGVLGLVAAVGLGVALFKGSIKVNLRKFFAVTTLVLLLVAVQLFVSGIHELSEARVLPSGPREMALIGPIVNNDAFFFVLVVALAVFLISAQRLRATEPATESKPLSAPERRRLRAEQRRQQRWKMVGVAVGVAVIISISAEYIYSRSAQNLSPPESVSLTNGEARIALNGLADHRLHRFTVQAGGASLRFIALLDSSDTVRAALDACLICGNQGYYQDGANVICRHCGAAINAPTIGMVGGCNPIHVDYRVEGETLILTEEALAAGAKFFQ